MAAISPQCLFIIQMPNRQTLINAQRRTDGWRATFWICSLDFSCIIKVIRPPCPRIHVTSGCFDPQTRERNEVCYSSTKGNKLPLHWDDGVIQVEKVQGYPFWVVMFTSLIGTMRWMFLESQRMLRRFFLFPSLFAVLFLWVHIKRESLAEIQHRVTLW